MRIEMKGSLRLISKIRLLKVLMKNQYKEIRKFVKLLRTVSSRSEFDKITVSEYLGENDVQ